MSDTLVGEGPHVGITTQIIDVIIETIEPVIELHGNKDARFDDSSVSELVGALLVNSRQVTTLSLKFHQITDAGVADLCRLLEPENSILTCLDLEGNDISGGGAIALAAYLVRSDCQISYLDLSWNNIGPEGANAIADALQSNRSLRVLKLANCGLNYSALIALYTSIKNHPSIEELIVDRPVFAKHDSDICADHLSIALLNHPTLKRLSARYQTITDYGTSLIARSLSSRVNMTALNISCNKIGVKGAEHLASFILKSQWIEELDLSNNIIGDEGALAMAKALKASKTLHTLKLKNNNIRVEGLLAIGQAMRTNSTLKRLHLWGNAFDDTAGNLFMDLCENRFPYTDVMLDFTVYVVDGVHLVAEASQLSS